MEEATSHFSAIDSGGLPSRNAVMKVKEGGGVVDNLLFGGGPQEPSGEIRLGLLMIDLDTN